MINKKNLWFLTLFSLVLVLSIYYVTLPNELLTLNNSNTEVTTNSNGEDTESTAIEESNIISALRVEADDQVNEEIETLKKTLTDLNVTVEQKNQAFEQLKNINLNKAKEQELEDIIKDEFNVDAFIKVDNDQIRVVVANGEASATMANSIMRRIQEEFTNKMYISVKFQNT